MARVFCKTLAIKKIAKFFGMCGGKTPPLSKRKEPKEKGMEGLSPLLEG